MVGRPGRSKGCSNCRRRKKGCDLIRPSCGLCVKSQLKCGGYEDGLNVVIYTPSDSTSQASLQKSAFEVKYIDSFWEMLIPSMSSASRTSNRDWTRVIRDRYTSDGPFKNAMLALTLSRIGQCSGNDSVTRTGSVRYNGCLREISRTIQVQKNTCSDELIASCLVLSLYEIMCNPASPGTSWQSHMRGIVSFMQLRGPQAFISGLAHDLFVGARLQVIFASIVSREATFLDSYEWSTVPWGTNPVSKSPYDKIVDIFAHLPRILEMLDQLHITKPQETCDPEALLVQCWGLDNQLKVWCREFYTDQSASSHQIPDFDKPLNADAEIDYEHAQALSIYWVTCCFLYTTLRLVWQASDCPLYLLSQRIDPLHYASLITHSLPYFANPSAGEGSLVYYSISIGAALHCLSVADELNCPDSLRLIQVFELEGHPSWIGGRVGTFLSTLAAAGVGSRINFDTVTHEKIVKLGQKWWGGGTEGITLRPRKTASVSEQVLPLDSSPGASPWATFA